MKHCNYVLDPTSNIKTNYNCIYQNDPYRHAHGAFCFNARNMERIYSYRLSTKYGNIRPKGHAYLHSTHIWQKGVFTYT